MSTAQARRESGGCIRTSTVGDVTQVWDTGRPDAVLEVPTAAWEAHEAALRIDGWDAAVAALRAARFGGYGDVAAGYLESLTEVRDGVTPDA